MQHLDYMQNFVASLVEKMGGSVGPILPGMDLSSLLMMSKTRLQWCTNIGMPFGKEEDGTNDDRNT
jgi:hypothetical protein